MPDEDKPAKKKAAKKKAAKRPAKKAVRKREPKIKVRSIVIVGFKVVPIMADYKTTDAKAARQAFEDGTGSFGPAIQPEFPPSEACEDCDRSFDEPRGTRYIVKSVTDLTEVPGV